MKFANKMLLVPQNLLPNNGPETIEHKLASNLDREMQNIVQDNKLPSDVKLLRYNQVLNRFQKTLTEQNKPIELEIKNLSSDEIFIPENSLGHDAQNVDKFQKTYDKLAKIIPRTFKDKASTLLDYVLENPKLAISENQELIIDKNKINNSNIIDIISDISRPRKSIAPTGSEALVHVLLGSNVPKELFGNKQRLGKPTPIYASPSLENNSSDVSYTSDDEALPPPKSRKRNIQKGGMFLKGWSSL